MLWFPVLWTESPLRQWKLDDQARRMSLKAAEMWRNQVWVTLRILGRCVSVGASALTNFQMLQFWIGGHPCLSASPWIKPAI